MVIFAEIIENECINERHPIMNVEDDNLAVTAR